MNTEFYKQMLMIKRQKECSIREFAKECNVSHGTLISFFDLNKPFRPVSEKTMAKIHNHFGIAYKVMEDYNKEILKERGE